MLIRYSSIEIVMVKRFSCGHFEISSVLLFRTDGLEALDIRKSFSERHRLQRFNSLEYALAWAAMDHLISKAFSLSFKFQMNLESSVLVRCLSCLNDCVWPLYRCLKEFSVRPKYTFWLVVFCSDTVAL